jgi:hypothetical protein
MDGDRVFLRNVGTTYLTTRRHGSKDRNMGKWPKIPPPDFSLMKNEEFQTKLIQTGFLSYTDFQC